MKNVKPAVWIIAALSLLLGLSLGQIDRQYRQIQNLESSFGILEPMQIRVEMNHCNRDFNIIRTEIEVAKEMMRLEREAQLRELHEQIKMVRQMHRR